MHRAWRPVGIGAGMAAWMVIHSLQPGGLVVMAAWMLMAMMMRMMMRVGMRMKIGSEDEDWKEFPHARA